MGKVLCTDGSIYENVSAATTAGKTAVAMIAYVDETNKNGLAIALADEGDKMDWSTAESTCENKTPAITGAKWCLPSQDNWIAMFKANGGNEESYTGLNNALAVAGGDDSKLQVGGEYWTSTLLPGGAASNVSLDGGNAAEGVEDMGNGYLVRACLAFDIAEPAIDFKWDAANKTGTFVMPAFDVEIAPIYAPTAVFDTKDDLVLTPTAIEGIYAESTDAIVKAGTVAKIGETENVQGTLMYAVSTSATEQPALTAFSATLPTAEKIAAGDVYVWYYIKGADTPQGQEASAENTFNDSEICAEPLKVTVLNNKFNIQFKAANANTIEADKATVTVGGTAATVTEGKLQGVKMGSEVKVTAKDGYKFRKVEVKKAPKTITIGEQNYTVLDGETWKQFITRNQLSGWSVQPSLDTTWRVRMDAGIAVFTICISTDGTNWEPLILTSEDAPIDTDKQYKWG